MAHSLKKNLKAGDVFEFHTHAKFLNEVFGTNYRAWMKGSWNYTADILVWFVRINDTLRAEFKNYLLDSYTIIKKGEFENFWIDSNTIIQICNENKKEFGGVPLHLVRIPDYRLVFEIKDGYQRKYIFKGFFRYNREKSVPQKLIFEKVSDIFPRN